MSVESQYQYEIDKLKEERSRLIDALVGMVNQHCSPWDSEATEDVLDSNFLSANAEAMRLLEEFEVLDIELDGGRMVRGKFRKPEEWQ